MPEHNDTHPGDSPPPILALDHIALRMNDMQDASSWLAHTLGLEDAFPNRWNGVPQMMFTSAKAHDDPGTGIALAPRDQSSNQFAHMAFRVRTQDMPRWKAWLTAQNIPFEREDHEVCESIYFEGPEGLAFELTAYFK